MNIAAMSLARGEIVCARRYVTPTFTQHTQDPTETRIAKSQQFINLISPVPDEISCAGFELSNSSSRPAAFWSEVTAMSEGIEQ